MTQPNIATEALEMAARPDIQLGAGAALTLGYYVAETVNAVAGRDVVSEANTDMLYTTGLAYFASAGINAAIKHLRQRPANR